MKDLVILDMATYIITSSPVGDFFSTQTEKKTRIKGLHKLICYFIIINIIIILLQYSIERYFFFSNEMPTFFL